MGVDGVVRLYGQIAEEKQDPNALFTVGWMYNFGLGDVAKDHRKAYAYYTAAVEAGHEMAAYQMALLQLGGSGTRKAPVKAVENFEKAAAGGNGLAMLQLAKIYEKGCGDEVVKDTELSKSWYEKSAAAGNAVAKKHLG